ncbi:helix-turn-helix domain-containing protein [Leifsonia sp. L25]|uniref:helix-turn-helix domain-containing protein n=1 Tax=Leifsonia sp. L25 TaxID=3423957 RepID=UPI003D6830EC
MRVLAGRDELAEPGSERTFHLSDRCARGGRGARRFLSPEAHRVAAGDAPATQQVQIAESGTAGRTRSDFAAVAEERHFTRAASCCGISQAGAQRIHLGWLEQESLGTSLFARSTRRVELTGGRAGAPGLDSVRTLASAAAAAGCGRGGPRVKLRGRLT